MQVVGRFHVEKMPVDSNGDMRVTTDAENLYIGSQILSEYLHREHGNLATCPAALQRECDGRRAPLLVESPPREARPRARPRARRETGPEGPPYFGARVTRLAGVATH